MGMLLNTPLGDGGLMITIICMGMIMYPAKTKVKIMGNYNKGYCRNKQPCFIVNEK
jgi:hypothetical protein